VLGSVVALRVPTSTSAHRADEGATLCGQIMENWKADHPTAEEIVKP